MTTNTIQAVRGMNDVLPEAGAAWDHLESTVFDCLRRYGYRPIRMPLVERTELFVRSIGEVTDIVEKEMYTFTDRLNGDSLTLRPEGTASCVRAVLEHNLLYAGPQRLYYSGPMFRHERPQKGRYRQFHQIGVEALGFAGPDIDAELIVMCARIWAALGLTEVSLELNTLGDLEARLRHRSRLIDYLQRHRSDLDDDAHRRLASNPLRVLDSKNPALQGLIEAAPRLTDDLDDAARTHFDAVQAILRDAGIAFRINPRLVRGLDYYNRTVFEWITGKLGAQSAVCAGGRYDGLMTQLGGKSAPACGFALGVERLIDLLEADGAHVPHRAPDLYVVHQGDGAERWAWRICERLRDQGLRVVLHCGGGNFKTQLRKADASGARFALVLGEDEAAAGKVSLKALRHAMQQVLVDVDEVPGLVNAHHGRIGAMGNTLRPHEE
ncbi:MAG: histidine--tRNA ligase [Burkholderiales bacterium]|nr:histidine--tRNA ligase [Burkholderiales bacterium]